MTEHDLSTAQPAASLRCPIRTSRTRGRSTHATARVAIGTSAVTVGNRDIERREAENAPVYVPILSAPESGWRMTFCARHQRPTRLGC